MKHQYFGDINDYRKYGILRSLSKAGLKTTVGWMLTKDDASNQGRNTYYLTTAQKDDTKDPKCDGELFESLYEAVIRRKIKSTKWVHKNDLIPEARYLNDFLQDNLINRHRYFEQLEQIAKGSNILFFDPDNGLEVKSRPKGKKNSNKYLYWDEVKNFWNLGYSLLIYQHFPRVSRLNYIRSLAKELRSNTGAAEIITLKTSTVAFFLLVQPKHRKKIHAALEFIREKWEGMIEVV
jgi:hypothetical protein